MSRKPLRVGVVGVGAIAQGQHLPHWQNLAKDGRIELAAVCDVVPERAEEVAQRFGARQVFSDYATMLASGLDIVDVCTQNRLHCPVTLAALKAGAHVLVEKPMAMNAREARKMVETAAQHRRKLMVAQHMRFQSDSEYLKGMVEQGCLGDIYTAKANYLRQRGVPGWGRFHIGKESLGGPLIDVGVHILDLCLWWMGFPKAVAASGKVYRCFGDRPVFCNKDWPTPYDRKEFDVEDYATAFIRFEGGKTLILETSWAANLPQDIHNIWLLGDQGGLTQFPPATYHDCGQGLTSTRADWLPRVDPYRAEIEHFLGCVVQDTPVRVQPAESLQVQQIIDAIYASSMQDKEVRIR